MNDVFRIFSNEMFGQVRTIYDTATNEIWFLGTDVAKCLGYVNPRDAILKHTNTNDRKALKYKACRDLRQTGIWGTSDYADKVFINESGLFCLIFGSHKEIAQEFKFWVTREVLPSIRKNGGYILGQENLEKDELEEVTSELKLLSAKVAKLQKRRHELIKERDKAKEAAKKNKVTAKKLEIEANAWIEIFEDLQAEYDQLVRKYECSKPEPQIKESAPDRYITVDSNGFIVNIA